jgi:tetratricopeptide (TPR) repeat protein
MSILEVFLRTEFQRQLEHVERLMTEDADPAKPYEYKYQARALIEALRDNPLLNEESDSSVVARAILEYLLGVNHFETEEITRSGTHYAKAFELITKVSPEMQFRHLTTLQDLLNALGIHKCNQDDVDTGLKFFDKAVALYDLANKAGLKQCTSSFQDFLNCRDPQFTFIIDGGLNGRKVEQNYTLTLFYLAQAHSKQGRKDEAAWYCVLTMSRQVASGDFQVKDWAVNAINMAEYYSDLQMFSQAYYMLAAALSLVPQGRKMKLRNTLHMQLGRCLLGLMEYSVTSTREGLPEPEAVKQQKITFPCLPVEWVELSLPYEVEAAKDLFRRANAYLKEALEFFVIDGYVTEHVEMKRDLCRLYKFLSVFEPDNKRLLAMTNRRLELLEGYTQELNSTAYPQLWQHLKTEVSSIFIDLYELKSQSGRTTQKAFEQANACAMKSIVHQGELLEFIQKYEMTQETAKDIVQSSLNLMFGVARTYSRLETLKPKQKVEFLSQSFLWYERLSDYLKKVQNDGFAGCLPDFEEQKRICAEMVSLLPMRIAQVNAGVE